MGGSKSGNSRELFQDGVRVRQIFTDDEFNVPAIRIQLESKLNDAVLVTLQVELPEGDEFEKVGFHPDYDPENWSFDDNHISYKRRLSPSDEITTVYAMQDLAESNASVLLDNLIIQSVSPIEDEGATSGDEETEPAEKPHDENGSVGSGRSGSRSEDEVESVTAITSEAPENDPHDSGEEDSESEKASAAVTDPPPATETVVNADGRDEDGPASEPNSSSESSKRQTDPAVRDEAGTAPPNDISEYSDARLVQELVRRLESGQLSGESWQALGERIGSTDSEPDSGTERRIADLQRRVSDVEAFSTSVEAVHEAHGPPKDVIDGLQTKLDGIDDTVAGLENRVDDLEARSDDYEARTDSIETDTEKLTDDLNGIKDELDSAATVRSELESEVSDLLDWRQKFVGSLTEMDGE